MSAKTAVPPAREDLDQLLAKLTDDERKYLLVKLLGPVLAPIKEKRAIYDDKGDLLGDYVPFPRVQPGQKVGMTDEERAELAKIPRISAEEARARREQAAAARKAELAAKAAEAAR